MIVFLLSALGLIPLAKVIGDATEELAVYTGPKLGGLLNATLGNAAELIITIFAIQAGLLDLVRASITGSIIGNLLLVLGFSIVAGGWKHGIQTFDRRTASINATLAGAGGGRAGDPVAVRPGADRTSQCRTVFQRRRGAGADRPVRTGHPLFVQGSGGKDGKPDPRMTGEAAPVHEASWSLPL